MKRFIIVLAILAVVIGGLAAAIFVGLPYYLAPQSQLQKADVIVAVSGGETTSRTLEAVKLYKEGYAPQLIFSGAAEDPKSVSNAAAMRKIAITAGVPASAISVEEDSSDTHENAVDVARIIKQRNYTSVILVTSPYHQRRASIEFKRALGSGVRIINHSANDQNWRRSGWWQSDYSLGLTLSEFQKIIFIYVSQPKSNS